MSILWNNAVDHVINEHLDDSLSGLCIKIDNSNFNITDTLMALPLFDGDHRGHVETHNPPGSSQSDQVISVILNAPTSPAMKVEEESLTYLNQGQPYELKFQCFGNGITKKTTLLKSYVKVTFHDRRLLYCEDKQISLWRSEHPAERILEVDTPLSRGIIDAKNLPYNLNLVEVSWDPFKTASLYIKINCISTEFTPKKHGGEKGVPFRLQTETYALEDGQFKLIYSAGCQVKIFKPKGADRKHKTDREKFEKQLPNDKFKYQPSCPFTVLSENTNNADYMCLTAVLTSDTASSGDLTPQTVIDRNNNISYSFVNSHTDVQTIAKFTNANMNPPPSYIPNQSSGIFDYNSVFYPTPHPTLNNNNKSQMQVQNQSQLFHASTNDNIYSNVIATTIQSISPNKRIIKAAKPKLFHKTMGTLPTSSLMSATLSNYKLYHTLADDEDDDHTKPNIPKLFQLNANSASTINKSLPEKRREIDDTTCDEDDTFEKALSSNLSAKNGMAHANNFGDSKYTGLNENFTGKSLSSVSGGHTISSSVAKQSVKTQQITKKRYGGESQSLSFTSNSSSVTGFNNQVQMITSTFESLNAQPASSNAGIISTNNNSNINHIGSTSINSFSLTTPTLKTFPSQSSASHGGGNATFQSNIGNLFLEDTSSQFSLTAYELGGGVAATGFIESGSSGVNGPSPLVEHEDITFYNDTHGPTNGNHYHFAHTYNHQPSFNIPSNTALNKDVANPYYTNFTQSIQQIFHTTQSHHANNGYRSAFYNNHSTHSSDTAAWLESHAFSPFIINCFKDFSALDMRRLSRQDLIDICGVADGIRLNNALQCIPARPRLTLYITRRIPKTLLTPAFISNHIRLCWPGADDMRSEKNIGSCDTHSMPDLTSTSFELFDDVNDGSSNTDDVGSTEPIFHLMYLYELSYRELCEKLCHAFPQILKQCYPNTTANDVNIGAELNSPTTDNQQLYTPGSSTEDGTYASSSQNISPPTNLKIILMVRVLGTEIVAQQSDSNDNSIVPPSKGCLELSGPSAEVKSNSSEGSLIQNHNTTQSDFGQLNNLESVGTVQSLKIVNPGGSCYNTTFTDSWKGENYIAVLLNDTVVQHMVDASRYYAHIMIQPDSNVFARQTANLTPEAMTNKDDPSYVTNNNNCLNNNISLPQIIVRLYKLD